ncbi:hypothetical protein E2C01_054337 [Portunus trituberculatus]|uniref:Uncharacterized protein n=1 Tax=Portunus trituberculatus TaxID=210409 RepID=A0A5B7GRP7_PORTR|nr:hypothetical protein [Portunus trituberculatus]
MCLLTMPELNVIQLGTALVDYITTNLDRLMAAHPCDNVIIIGSILNAVVTDLHPHEVRCSPLGPVGTSDHKAILTRAQFRRTRDESFTCTLCRWEEANWEQLRHCLERVNWASLLQGDVDQQAERLTEVLLRAQERWVPHKQHKVAHLQVEPHVVEQNTQQRGRCPHGGHPNLGQGAVGEKYKTKLRG